MTRLVTPDATVAWLDRLSRVLASGEEKSPRGKLTLDQSHAVMRVNLRQPVVKVPERQLSYKFMAAEAYWILSGSNQVDELVPWNANMAQFSDDGQTFFGAYGPRIQSQLDYVVQKLVEDPSSRQAGLTIWRENPPPTKDYPCTVSMFFHLNQLDDNQQVLDMTVFMRSSDTWLGIPYDVFSFSMVAHQVCCRLNKVAGGIKDDCIVPGNLGLMLASSHLYEPNFEAARAVTRSWHGGVLRPHPQPDVPWTLAADEERLMDVLRQLRDSKPGDPLRWWEA